MFFNSVEKVNDTFGDLNLRIGRMYVAELNDLHTYTLPEATPDTRGQAICIQLVGINTVNIATSNGDTLCPQAVSGNQFTSGLALFLISDGDGGWAQFMGLAGGPERFNP